MTGCKVVNWVRRKIGPDICVWRYLNDGSMGCATPCLLCQRVLLKFDLRVHCCQVGGEWFSGKLSDSDAPASVLTSGQRRMFDKNYGILPPVATVVKLQPKADLPVQIRKGSKLKYVGQFRQGRKAKLAAQQ